MTFRDHSFTIGDIGTRMGFGAGPQFLRVLQIEDGSVPDDVSAPPAPVLTIDLGPRCRLTIPSGFDMEAAARLLNGLMVRS